MNGKRKALIYAILTLMMITMAGVGFYYWYQNAYYVATEDAKVTGDLVRVSPQISGKLLEFNLKEGQLVQAGQMLGRQEMSNLPEGHLEMAILRAPISGLVLKKQGTIGEVVAPGQVLAMLVNPEELYISANIEETKLDRLQVGQWVDITIDEHPREKFSGEVDSIGEATSATFSLLPATTVGNFTKVAQKVPVKIRLHRTESKLRPGTSAVIKIYVK